MSLSDAYYARPEEGYDDWYMESDDDIYYTDDNTYYTPEAELVDSSSNNQGVQQQGPGRIGIYHNEENIILYSDDDFGYVFNKKPESSSFGRRPVTTTKTIIEIIDTPVVLVAIGMALLASLVVFVHWYRKRQKMWKERAIIARNLEGFDADDIDLHRDPSGGYHGFYDENAIDPHKLLKHNEDTASEESYEDNDPVDAFLAPVEYSNYDDVHYARVAGKW